MLRRLCLELARRLEIGNERQVHEASVLISLFEAELARGLEERERLDVARYSTYFAEDDVWRGLVAMRFAGASYRRLDFVSDVRHDLHRAAEVAPCALARENGRVDAAGGVVRRLGARHAREALIVAEVEVCLCPVVSHEYLAVLVWRHRAGVDVEIRVELLHEDPVAATLQEKRK